LLNRENGNTVVVGNVCVTRFLGLDSEALFRALRRIRKNPGCALSTAIVERLWELGLVSEWERGFLQNTTHRRRLSERQRAKRTEINVAVHDRVAQEGRHHA
jgi:hypothetical protein